MRIEFLSKPGCHLCDVAKNVVRHVCAQKHLSWEEINIENRPDLLDLYKEEIPVVLMDGKKLFKYFVDERKFSHCLDRALRRQKIAGK